MWDKGWARLAEVRAWPVTVEGGGVGDRGGDPRLLVTSIVFNCMNEWTLKDLNESLVGGGEWESKMAKI